MRIYKRKPESDKADIRAIDDLGRIVVPMTFRKLLNLKPGDAMELSLMDTGEIVITKMVPSCAICGSKEEIVDLDGKHVCASCVKKIKEL